MDHSPGFLQLVAKTKQRIRETTPEEVRRRQDAGERFHLVDVREDGEWRQGRARDLPEVRAVHLRVGGHAPR